MRASRSPVEGPSWWTPLKAYFGNFETRTDPRGYFWDGMQRLGPHDRPLVFFQLTLAGWGNFEIYGRPPQRQTPGSAFFAVIPSRHRYYLPEGSPGWTFAWIGIYHPYILRRIAKLVEGSGPVLSLSPSNPLTTAALRLVQGAFEKGFRDHLEVELALFEFLTVYERLTEQMSDPGDERRTLLDWVRELVLASPKSPLDVGVVAAKRGMSRSHFSHYFQSRTGRTPARFMMEVRVQEAARQLLTSQRSLKEIASAWGFANVNHFGKTFQRYQQMSPGSYRRSFGG
ncbi:MAG TPA: AraC family transcriptional regulator [Polyangiaceae bacterium]|nr:AraC family transcriptional regulator [Polyangiaceae bacterium]